MPKLLPLPLSNEERLRAALVGLLDRLGALPPSPGERTVDSLVWLAERVTLGREEFAVAPELDKDLPF